MFIPLLAILALLGEAKLFSAVAVILCVVLMVAILVKLLHVGVFILLHPHALGMLGVFALIAFLFAGFVKLQAPPGAAAVVGNGQNAIVAMAGKNKAVVQNAPWAAKADADVKPAEMSEEVAANPAPKKSSDAGNTNHTTDAKGPPEWTNQPPHRQGDSYVVVLRLDPETSGTERDEWLDQRMLVAAKDYIDERLYPGKDVSKIAKFDVLDAQYLYSNCVKEIYPSSGLSDVGKEAFVRMEFDRKFRAEVDRRYRESLEVDRLRSFSGIAVLGLTVLSGLYLYLRTTAKKGVIEKKKPEVAAATS